MAAWHTARRGRGQRPIACSTRQFQLVLCLRLADVDEPGDAELVDDDAELVAPGLLLHRHGGGPAGGQLLPVAPQDVPVVAAQADPEARRGMIVAHVAGVVGGHHRICGVALKLAVHDLVSVRGVLAAEVSVCADGKGAAKHALVELKCLAGVAVEVEVRIQPGRHRLLLPPCDGGGRGPPPGPADRIVASQWCRGVPSRCRARRARCDRRARGRPPRRGGRSWWRAADHWSRRRERPIRRRARAQSFGTLAACASTAACCTRCTTTLRRPVPAFSSASSDVGWTTELRSPAGPSPVMPRFPCLPAHAGPNGLFRRNVADACLADVPDAGYGTHWADK